MTGNPLSNNFCKHPFEVFAEQWAQPGSTRGHYERMAYFTGVRSVLVIALLHKAMEGEKKGLGLVQFSLSG